jgi:hypothetical protein
VTAAFRVEGDEVEARGSRGTVRRPLQWWVPVLLSRRGAVDAFADLEAATGPLGGLLPVPFYVPGLDSI